jgi:hypothetical protein
MSEKRVTGPIQVFVIGFEQFEATGHGTKKRRVHMK